MGKGIVAGLMDKLAQTRLLLLKLLRLMRKHCLKCLDAKHFCSIGVR